MLQTQVNSNARSPKSIAYRHTDNSPKPNKNYRSAIMSNKKSKENERKTNTDKRFVSTSTILRQVLNENLIEKKVSIAKQNWKLIDSRQKLALSVSRISFAGANIFGFTPLSHQMHRIKTEKMMINRNEIAPNLKCLKIPQGNATFQTVTTTKQKTGIFSKHLF